MLYLKSNNKGKLELSGDAIIGNNINATVRMVLPGPNGYSRVDCYMLSEVKDGNCTILVIPDGCVPGYTCTFNTQPLSSKFYPIGMFYKIPHKELSLDMFDILKASGGNSALNDKLNLDFHISKARGHIMDSHRSDHSVEVCGLSIYPDTSSGYIDGEIKYSIYECGRLATLKDHIRGVVNFKAGTVSLESTTGITKQVCFEGTFTSGGNV